MKDILAAIPKSQSVLCDEFVAALLLLRVVLLVRRRSCPEMVPGMVLDSPAPIPRQLVHVQALVELAFFAPVVRRRLILDAATSEIERGLR